METILVIGYTLLFLFIIRKNKFFSAEGVPKKIFSWAFVLKVIAGIAYGIIFTRWIPQGSTTDSFVFFNDSKILFDSAFIHPKHFFEMLSGFHIHDRELNQYFNRMVSWTNTDVFYNDNQTMIRMNAFLRIFSFGYYNVHVVFISFLSMMGLTGIFRIFHSYLANKTTALIVAVFFIPSTVFWTSALLKDGIMIFALGLMLFHFHRMMNGNFSRRVVLLFLASFIFLFFIKFYIVVAIVPGLLGWLWTRHRAKFSLLKFFSLYAIYFFLLFNAWRVIPNYELHDFIYWKQKNFVEEAVKANSRTIIKLDLVERNPWSVMAHGPGAFLTVLTRPVIFESSSLLLLVPAIENFLMLIFMLICLLTMSKKSARLTPIFYVSIFFVLIIYALIGLVTPVLGGIVRYRAVVTPFLLFIFISLYDKEKFSKIFSRKRKQIMASSMKLHR